MNNHVRKAVVLGLAISALLSTSGCFGGGGGGLVGLFDGSSAGDILAAFGGPGSGDESNGLFGGDEGGFELLSLFSGDDQDWESGEEYDKLPPVATVHNPEPMSLGLFGAGLVALGASRRRKKTLRRSNRR